MKLFKFVRRGVLYTPILLVDIFYFYKLISHPWMLFPLGVCNTPLRQTIN